MSEVERLRAELAALRHEVERIARIGEGAIAELERLRPPSVASVSVSTTHGTYVAGLRRALAGGAS